MINRLVSSFIQGKKLVSATFIKEIPCSDFRLLALTLGHGSLGKKVKYNVKIYKIVYHTNYIKEKITCSGLLYLPVSNESLPFLSFHHGTTFKKSEAPSIVKGFSGLEFFAAAGYICFRPDYIGYGESEEYFHPYYDSKHSASCVIDFLAAGKEFLCKEKIRFNEKLFLAGYSEGGYITLATQKELERNNPLGVKPVAVAAGAGGYDLFGMLDSLSTGSSKIYPSYLAFLILSFEKVYKWNKPLNYYFSEKYAKVIPELLDGAHDSIQINGKLSSDLTELFNPEFYKNLRGSGEMELKKALLLNSLTNWKPKTPLRLYHGLEDEIIPFKNSESTFIHLQHHGANDVELVPIPGGTHVSSLIPMIESFVPWFDSYL